nr:YheC/YheD family protein [Paenibacillus sp. E194]
MKQLANVTLLGIGLRGKWGIYRSMRKDSSLSPILPPTRLFAGISSLAALLNRYHGGLFLKPHGGTHGKSTLHVRYRDNDKEKSDSISDAPPGTLELRGRDDDNHPIQHSFSRPQEGFAWIEQFVGKRRFVIQPYLSLVTQEGEPFDVRVLMQKTETAVGF